LNHVIIIKSRDRVDASGVDKLHYPIIIIR